MYPNVWGQGALFAFSGLDGRNTLQNSLCGHLMGDRIGISFRFGEAELYLSLHGVRDITYQIVASDIIEGKLNGRDFLFLFTDECTVSGFCPTDLALPIFRADRPQAAADYRFAQRADGNVTRFALSCGADAEARADAALTADPMPVASGRLAFYDRIPLPANATPAEQRTYLKCFSVMRSQVYTPEGRFGRRWTTPDRLPHKYLWLWDSVFHSMGNVFIDPQLAYESILSVLDTQQEDGFIPHMATPDTQSDVTQPPVIAWGLWALYERTGRTDWLRETYDRAKRYLAWDACNRDDDDDLLPGWYIDPSDPNCRCGESGMDNSPRFDDVVPMDCIDFSCFLAHEYTCMSRIAAVLGLEDEATAFSARFDAVAAQINALLYDETDGRYYDRETGSGKLRRVRAVSGFLPLFAGVCSPQQAARLAADLKDPATFGTALGVPSIAVSDPTFGSDMWRGPVWINYNYMIILGLRQYGYEELADALTDATLAAITARYEQEGVIYEYYDCQNAVSPALLNRKGAAIRPYSPGVRMASIRDYGWSCTLFVRMLAERSERRSVKNG